MEFVLCMVVYLTILDPISLGTMFVLECVLGTLDTHCMLVSMIRKVVPPYEIFGDKLG